MQQVGLNKAMFFRLHKVTKLVLGGTRSGNILNNHICGKIWEKSYFQQDSQDKQLRMGWKKKLQHVSMLAIAAVSTCMLLGFSQHTKNSIPCSSPGTASTNGCSKFHALSSFFFVVPDFQPNRQVQLAAMYYILKQWNSSDLEFKIYHTTSNQKRQPCWTQP